MQPNHIHYGTIAANADELRARQSRADERCEVILNGTSHGSLFTILSVRGTAPSGNSPLSQSLQVVQAVVGIVINDFLLALSQGAGWILRKNVFLNVRVVVEEEVKDIVGVQKVDKVGVINHVVGLSKSLPGFEIEGLVHHLVPHVIRAHIESKHRVVSADGA